jgi:hypothetical protein
LGNPPLFSKIALGIPCFCAKFCHTFAKGSGAAFLYIDTKNVSTNDTKNKHDFLEKKNWGTSFSYSIEVTIQRKKVGRRKKALDRVLVIAAPGANGIKPEGTFY